MSESDGHSCDFNSELAQNCFFYYKGDVIEEKIKGRIQEEIKREQRRICLHGIERF